VAGFEFEREGNRLRSFRTGLDYYRLRYPNFQSLSSQQFGSEIAAGTNVLDLNAVDWLTNFDWSLWERSYLSFSALFSPRFYTDSKVVQETGLFSGTNRRDLYFWNAANLYHGFNAIRPESWNIRNAAGFFTSIAINNSNQNNFDANATHFSPNYYSYTEWQAGPRWNTKLGVHWDLDLGYTFSQRRYTDRPVRSATGTYTSGKVNNEIQIYTANARYKLPRGFALNASIAHQISKANQKFEQTYKYNFISTHYFLGISYAN
jgi:hypothetical protein